MHLHVHGFRPYFYAVKPSGEAAQNANKSRLAPGKDEHFHILQLGRLAFRYFLVWDRNTWQSTGGELRSSGRVQCQASLDACLSSLDRAVRSDDGGVVTRFLRWI